MTTPTQGEHAQTEALKHAEGLEWFAERAPGFGLDPLPLKNTAAFIRRLHAQVAALTAQPAAAPQGVAYAPSIEDLCARIKAADDAAADRDYMLDSNDCIAVLRGQWKGPMAMDKPDRAPHGQAPAWATPWRSAVLDLIDECPGLTMEQDHWLSRRVKELDFPSAPRPTAQAAPAAGAVAGPVWEQPVTVDFKQAAEILEMFGGAVGEVALMKGTGHSGHGLYAMWTADPEGTIYLGETDEDAAPTPAAQADSVLEDAARGYELVGYINRGIEYHNKGKTIFHIKPTQNLKARWWTPDIAVYAARKQGAKHD